MVTTNSYQSLQDIEQAIGEAFISNHSRQLQIEHSQYGTHSVHIEQYNDFSIMSSSYSALEKPLHVPVRPKVPSILMAFGLKGTAGLIGNGWEVAFKANQQVFNVFPTKDSTYYLPAHSKAEGIVIELELNTALLDEFIQHNDNELTNTLYQGITKVASLHSLKENLPTDKTSLEIIASIQHCPYKGKLREVYLASQVKLLLIHQLSLVYQLQKGNNQESVTKLTKADEEKLYELRLYIDSNFLQEHSLQNLSRQFGINLFKLKYGFKKLFNTSVMKYIDDKKLQYAQMLLQKENVTVFEVADTLNYGHYNNFSAAYKRKFGYSPQVLRKNYEAVNRLT